jgi:symplekin
MFERAFSISDRNDSHHWQLMLAIKSNILRQMDTAPSGVRICCVKFVQQVVLVQTPGTVDPRVDTTPSKPNAPISYNLQRVDPNDVSLALVPRDHPLMSYTGLEAEGQGLLDRLLGIIHGDHRSDSLAAQHRVDLTGNSDALLVTAVLNSLGMLMQRRPIVANKILASIFNFNPLKLANSPMTPKNKVIMNSIERTTRALLINIIKRYAHPQSSYVVSMLTRLTVLETRRIPIMPGYISMWNVCEACGLTSSMNPTARDLRPPNPLMD